MTTDFIRQTKQRLLLAFAVFVSGNLLLTNAWGSDDMEYSGFNPALLSGSAIDVSRYTYGNVVLPGKYISDVYINQQWLGRRDIVVKNRPGTNQTTPCINKTLLIQLGVDWSALVNGVALSALSNDACIDVASEIPAATVDFDASELKLTVSIPQLYLTRISRGYVGQEEWSDGINAGFLSYNLNSYQNSALKGDGQLFAALNMGLNIEGWRLRYNGSYSQSVGSAAPWQTMNAYVQHDVTSLQSQFILGDAYTSNDLFNSVAFQGFMLASDDRMLPESQRGYAPVIRGVAETNARVVIRQGGNIIYETTVPPGEFKIEDMYNSSFAGDFQVQVQEADGRLKQFTVPYSAGVLLLRPGANRYSLALGKLLNVTTQNAPLFSQAQFQHGYGHDVTGYAGVVAASYYSAAQLGLALNTSVGAWSLDLTRSLTKLLPFEESLLGRSWRLSYSNVVEASHTNFSMAAYRYSTSNYLTLSDAALVNTQQNVPQVIGTINKPRSSFQISVSQPLSEGWGSCYVNGISQAYWNGAPDVVNYQAGYSNGFSWGSFNAAIGRSIDALGAHHNLLTVGINIPIGNELSAHRPLVTGTFTSGQSHNTAQVGMNGTLGESSRTSYNLYDNYEAASAAQNSAGAGVQYASQYGQLGASFSNGSSRQLSMNASGAVIAHAGGILLAPSLGETIGIVSAPGAAGASVNSAFGNQIDESGYAVLPYLTPYMNNEVVLNPKGSGRNVELDSTSQQIAPRAGAIVLLKFATTIGRAVLFKVLREDGKAPPVGASVFVQDGKEIGMLTQGGRLFNRSLSGQGILAVKWGAELSQQCLAPYVIPQETEQQSEQAYQQVTVSCLMSNE